MVLLNPPAFVQAGVYSALLDRMHLNTTRVLANFNSFSRSARGGFFVDRFPQVNISGMTFTCGPCAGSVVNDFATAAGDYVFSNPSNVVATIATASGTQNRYDIVGFQVKDNFYDASGQNQAVLTVLQGTYASGTPSDPPIPLTFLPLVRVVVNAGSTSPTLVDLRTKTTSAGGILPIGSDAERTALGTPYPGFGVWRTDQSRLQFHTGTTWKPVPEPTVYTGTGSTEFSVPAPRAVIPGCSVTFTTLNPNAVVVVRGQIDWELGVAGTGYNHVRARLDGTELNAGRSAFFNSAAAGTRIPGAGSWNGTAVGIGSHTVDLTAGKDVAAGNAVIHAGHTAVYVTVYD